MKKSRQVAKAAKKEFSTEIVFYRREQKLLCFRCMQLFFWKKKKKEGIL